VTDLLDLDTIVIRGEYLDAAAVFRCAYAASPHDITPGDKDTRQQAVAFSRVTLRP
jgi:hypothetical protein